MPMFVPKPGTVARVVVRTTHKITATKDSIRVSNRINPPNTVSKTKSPIIRHNEVKKVVQPRTKSIINKSVRDTNEKLISSYIEKINSIKNIGANRILVMVACGPSVLEVDTPKLVDNKYIDIMTINKPDKRIWPTKYWAFCDQSQYKRNESEFNSYNGMLINSASIKSRHRNQILIRNRSGSGFSTDLTQGFYIGRSTTYANLQTALWMNYKYIFVIGMDMCAVMKDGQKVLHYYGKNPDVADDNREKRFELEAKSYEYAAGYLAESDRKKIYFASSYNTWGFVNKFNKLDHKDAVEFILRKAEELNNN